MYLDNQDAFEFARRRDTAEEIDLYDYVRQLSKKSSDEAKNDFYRLLFAANTYPEQSVLESLRRITATPEFSDTGKYVINRCFYTVGYLWLHDTTRHGALKELIMDAEIMPQSGAMDRHARIWRKQLEEYVDSNLYTTLKRQMHLLEGEVAPDPQMAETFGYDLKSYPFVHEAATVTEDIPQKLRSSICQERAKRMELLNQKLRQYVDCRKRADEAPLPNPTSISDKALKQSIWEYRPDRENSILLQAKDFSQDMSCRNLRQFRQELSSYIRQPLTEVDSRYRQGRFVYYLEQALQQGKADDMAINDVSVIRICCSALQFMVVESIKRPRTVEFSNLIERVGHQVLTTVLLRIVLFCRRIRPWLESRFGILLHLYENQKKSDINWVVQAFEHMNIALALNYQQVGYFLPQV